MKKVKLMLGDNMESLKKLPDNSIDSIVSDVPYGLGKEQDMNIVLNDWLEKGYSEIKGSGFMGKVWDSYVPQPIFWKEAYRVLKPGGHVISFFGTRTYDIGTMAIRLAGFEIRDQIMWLYGSGFPKSHNIGKAVDKLQGNEREVVGKSPNERLNTTDNDSWDCNGLKKELNITKGQSPYEGWGTALKPSNEPICVARKPLSEKTIAENVIKWGTGGINIDGCRVSHNEPIKTIKAQEAENTIYNTGFGRYEDTTELKEEGRFPANIILDEIAGELLDEQSGIIKSSKFKPEYDGGFGAESNSYVNHKPGGSIVNTERGYNDKGGASRFFYQAKVSKQERNMSGKSIHPTMKPIQLMSYLCKLVTPPGGIILDPFSGSGSTGISALLNDFRFIGMELEKEYFDIMEKRVNDFENYRKFIKKV